MNHIVGLIRRLFGIKQSDSGTTPPLFENGIAVKLTTGVTAGTTQTQAGAAALSYGMNRITVCANAGDGVRLPAASLGAEVVVTNTGAAAAKLWPATGDKIEGGTTNAGVTLPVGATFVCRGYDSSNWNVRRGFDVDGGVVTLDGSNPTPVTTRLTTVVAVALTMVSSSAPGDDPVAFTYTVSGGGISIYAWKNTGGTDPTLVASTNNSAVIGWVAIGH